MIIQGKRYKDFQVFKVKKHDEYIYAFLDSVRPSNYGIVVDVEAPLVKDRKTPNCHSSASLDYLYQDCYELSFAKCPKDIQEHLLNYVRGFE